VHGSAAEEMAVDVENRLTSDGVTVEDKTVAVKFEISGKLRCSKGDLANQVRVFLVNVVQGSDVVFGNNENVNRRLGIYVVEGKKFAGLESDFRGDLLLCDLTKKAVLHRINLARKT